MTDHTGYIFSLVVAAVSFIFCLIPAKAVRSAGESGNSRTYLSLLKRLVP